MKTNILKDAEHDFIKSIQYGNNILKKIHSNVLSDIIYLEINHVKYVMLDILNSYVTDKIGDVEVLNFIDVIEEVIYEKYRYDYPETSYPNLEESDNDSLGIDCVSYIDLLKFPNNKSSKQDIEKFIDFLNASDALKAHQDLRAYLYKKYPKSKDWI